MGFYYKMALYNDTYMYKFVILVQGRYFSFTNSMNTNVITTLDSFQKPLYRVYAKGQSIDRSFESSQSSLLFSTARFPYRMRFT